MSGSQQMKGMPQRTTTTDPTKKAAECCPGYKGGGVHDPSCVGTGMQKQADECCASYGAGGGVHDPSCAGMGVTGGKGVGMGVSGGTEKGALSIKDEKSIFKFIIDDHARVNSLYNQFNQTSNQEERNKIAGLIIKEITTHSFLEETVLYPMLDKKLNTEGLNMHEHSVQEHQKVKNLLYKLDQNFQTTNESFIATLNELMQHLRKHIDEEENQVLPKLQSKLQLNEEIDLGSSWETRLTSGAHPTHPHPSAPTSEPLASMAAMAAKPLDIARDAARFGSDAMKSMKEAMGGSAEQQKTTTTKK